MPNAFRKISLGQPIPRSASLHNATVDAALAERARRLGRSAAGPTQTRDACIIRVLNDTGDDLGRNAVVGLDGPIIEPADSEDVFLREVTFRAIVPTSDHLGKFAITLEPSRDGQVVRAFVAGVCMVKVNVLSTSHTRADASPAVTTSLATGSIGGAQILWREGGTSGEEWAIVRLGGGSDATHAYVSGTITAASGATLGTGSAVLCSRSGATLTADGDTVTLYNAGGEIVGPAYGTVQRVDGEWETSVFPCT